MVMLSCQVQGLNKKLLDPPTRRQLASSHTTRVSCSGGSPRLFSYIPSEHKEILNYMQPGTHELCTLADLW